MVLSTGPLDWESSALTTRPLLQYNHRLNYYDHYYCFIDCRQNIYTCLVYEFYKTSYES